MILIRTAQPSDLTALTAINNYYILNSQANFDVAPQTSDSKLIWFNKYKSTGPYQLLVAEDNKHVIGCAYSSRYRDHVAFDHTIETSIYLSPENRTKGVGTQLYTALFERLKSEKLHLAVAGIALPNEASIALHRKFGFEDVGVFKEYAIKNGNYISSVWMQKPLGRSS